MSQYQENDEFTHPPSGEIDFSESMYLNYFDRKNRVGGFLRVANRPNEGYAEVTNTTYLQDGSVLLSYQRPAISGNRTFEAGGMSFDVIQPFKSLKVSYEGTVFHFQDPKILKNPREAFGVSPKLNFQIDLNLIGTGELHDNVDRESEALDEIHYWKEHYEQVVRVSGQIVSGNTSWMIEGLGLRDHSWGPRTWQSPKYYRWLSGVFDEDSAFGLMHLVTPNEKESKKGFMTLEGKSYDLKDVKIDTEYTGADRYHNLINLSLVTTNKVFQIQGKVMAMLPLRNRKEGKMVRISEGMTEWNMHGKLGYGFSEYLDSIEN
jgi:hypothetical protein